MALQIANPVVVAKVEIVAKSMGISKTAAVEHGMDQILDKQAQADAKREAWAKFHAMLHQMDQIPDLENPIDPLEWDENGLPI